MSEYAARKILYRIEHGYNETEKDAPLESYIINKITEKFHQSREKGRHGWWNAEICSMNYLEQLLADHKKKGDPLDVLILQSMIEIRLEMEVLQGKE